MHLFAFLLLVVPLVSATHLHQHLDHYEHAFVTRITPLVHTSARPTPVAKLHDSEQWMVSAFGQHFMLTLNRNHQFLSSNYKSYVIHTDEDNRVEEVTADHGEGNRHHCYFFGQVNGVDTHAKSYAALSLCNGSLHGEIVTEGHTFFIEPNHLHFDYNPEKDYSDSCKGHTHCHNHWEHIQNTLKSSFGVERVHEDKLITKRLQHVVYKNEHHKSVRMECGVNHNGVHEDHDEHDHLHDVHFGGLAVNKLATGAHFDTAANRDINYVELLIVNDVKRKSTFASVNLMQANSEVLVYIVHTRYLVNNFTPQVHVILTAQISISGSTDPWGTPGVCSQPQYVGAIEHSDLLSKFSNWAYGSTVSGLITNGANWDNAHLLSGYHFCGYAVGFAGTGSMCFDGSSTGISQPLYADQQSANIITHEMGHNFNMNHDGTGNNCPQSGYIMAAVADLTANSYTTEFSTCSKAYYNNVMKYRPTSMACLNNLPEVRYASSCGNGWVDAGEECDCGSSDCSTIDPCCDGSTCTLVNAAECSNLDACCQSCQIVSSAQNKVCRAASHATCDYAEVCNGVSGLCPNDVFARTGASCSDGYGTGTYFNGKCYRGMCITLGAQCMGLYDNTSSACPGSSICGQPIQCNSYENTGACTSYPAFWGDGSSCGALSQCYNGNCIASTLLEYSWDTYCSLSCGSTVVTKQIKCRWYDGSWVADTFCSASTKPGQTGACGSFAPQICSSSLTTSTGTSNVAAGGSITLTWTTLFKVNYVIIMAVSSSSSWPEYLSLGSADDGTQSYTIPVKFASGPNVVQLWVASNVYANVSTIDVTDSCSSLSCGSNTCENGACVCPDSKQGDTCDSNYGLCPSCSCGSWRTGPNCEFMYAKLTIYHAPSTNALTTFDSASISGSTASLKERRRFGQLYQQEIAFLAYVNTSRVFVDYLSISVESDGSIGVPVMLVGNDTARASMEDLIVKLNYSIGAPYAGNASRLFAARHVNKNRAMKIEGDGLFPDGNQPVNFLDWIRNNPGAVAGIVIALAIIILALVCVKHPPEKVRETAQKVRRKHRKHKSRDRDDRDRFESEEGL